MDLYQTTNNVNGKIYIGVHKVCDNYRSKIYIGSGYALQSAIKKYSRKNFTRLTLAEFVCAKDAYEAEAQIVTEDFCAREDTYNMCLGGRGGGIQTPEIRAKISASRLGKKHTEETKLKVSIGNKGKVRSAEVKSKISEHSKGNQYNLGKTLTAETKAKMSAAHKGKVVTVETRAKLSAINKGKTKSEEHRAKISAAIKGHKISEEHKAKLIAANKGHKRNIGRIATSETKAKMSASSLSGAKNPKSLAVVINGNYYESARIASKSENTSEGTILSRVRNNNPKFENWRFPSEEEKLKHNNNNNI